MILVRHERQEIKTSHCGNPARHMRVNQLYRCACCQCRYACPPIMVQHAFALLKRQTNNSVNLTRNAALFFTRVH